MAYTFAMERLPTASQLYFAAAVVLAIAAIVCGIRFLLPAAVPAASVSDATAFSRALAAGEIRSVKVVGDSISAGYGTRGTVEGMPGQVLFTDSDGFSYPEPDHTNGAWTNHLRTYLADQGVNDFVNASISGRTFSDVDFEFDAWVGDGADAIIVMLGTNDSAMIGPDAFKEVSTRVLERIAERCDYLVVIAPPKRAADTAAPTKIAEVEEILSDICESHGWDFLSTYEVLETGTDDYQYDGLHPTTEGNDKLWAAIASQLGLG